MFVGLQTHTLVIKVQTNSLRTNALLFRISNKSKNTVYKEYDKTLGLILICKLGAEVIRLRCRCRLPLWSKVRRRDTNNLHKSADEVVHIKVASQLSSGQRQTVVDHCCYDPTATSNCHSPTSVVVKDLRLKDEDNDKESSFEDKDKDLKIGPRGSSRTKNFLEDNNTACEAVRWYRYWLEPDRGTMANKPLIRHSVTARRWCLIFRMLR